MKRMIARIMQYYGAAVSLETAGAVRHTRAFLRPMTNKGRESVRTAMAELGEIPSGQALFLGPPDCALDTASRLGCDGKHYLLRRAEKLLVGDECVCWWGILTPEGAEDAGIS